MTSQIPIPFWQLPPAPKPPHDPTWWLLNSRAGWHVGDQDGVAVSGDAVALEIVPGSGRQLNEPSGSLGGLVPPGNVAVAADCGIFLLDAPNGRLKRFDPCSCAFQNVPCLGGVGTGPRQVSDPHGIGICGGSLFICDTGNHRLLEFALRGMVLRAEWMPPASANLGAAWQPYAVAFDFRGRVYVSDPANSCIHRFSPAGVWLGSIAGFGNIRWIAFDCQNRLYAVIDGASAVQITGADGKPAGSASSAAEVASFFAPLPFSVDAHGDLNLSAMCIQSGTSGVFGADGGLVAVPPKDPPIAYQTSGTYWSEALDSSFYKCQWHRIVLDGQVPRKTAVFVSTFTNEVPLSNDQIQALPDDAWQTNLTANAITKEWEGLVFSGPGRYLWLRLILSGSGATTPRIHAVRIEFPRISLRRYLPAVFAQDPGGNNFTDRFLSVFDTPLRGIERKIDNEAAYFDPNSAPAGPGPSRDFLSWLASWIGISFDRQWPAAQRREFLKAAGKLQAIRGTRIGMWRQLLLLLGMNPERVCCPNDQPKTSCCPKPLNCAPRDTGCAWQPPALILENYQLRRWLFVGSGRLGNDAVLWGDRIINRSQLGGDAQAGVSQLSTTPSPFLDPLLQYANKFTVFVPGAFGASDKGKRMLVNLLESEKPAHTQYHIEYVAPRMRIGFQSMIGLDSVIARYPGGFRLGDALGGSSVLSGSPAHSDQTMLEIGRKSRIGSTARLG